MTASIFDNANWANARPALSVLTPFLRDDPRPLLDALDREAVDLEGQVEVILLDDGTGDAALTAGLERSLAALALPARLITLGANEGRSRGRNRLASAARGSSLLFLDSDMRPDHGRFLRDWLELKRTRDPAAAFGGFSLRQAPDDRRYAVHRAMATRSDCIDHRTRALQPEKHVFTSNLMVRRDVFDAEAFDPGFAGWGWEDVEWAMRVSRRFEIVHVDNTATHMGLDTVETLMAKYEQSAANYARLAARHPDFVSRYPSYRAARLLKAVPGHSLLRRAFRGAAGVELAPVRLRALSLRLYRAALYAEVL